MKNNNTKIESFTDLIIWKKAHEVVLSIYRITKGFPAEEKFSLADQMKRAAISISSNIAEGFSRKGAKEKSQFYFIAKGSLTELQNQLLVAKDVGYLDNKVFKSVADKTVEVHKLLNTFIKNLTSKY